MRQKVWREGGHSVQSFRISVCLTTLVLIVIISVLHNASSTSLTQGWGWRARVGVARQDGSRAKALVSDGGGVSRPFAESHEKHQDNDKGSGASTATPRDQQPGVDKHGGEGVQKGQDVGASPLASEEANGRVAVDGAMPGAPKDAHKANYAVLFLTFGCLAFGSYLLYCLCCGRAYSNLFHALRTPLCTILGRELTGVCVVEFAASAWCMGCLLTADYLHYNSVAPAATRCVRGACASPIEVLVAHVLPSLYINGTFFFNWYMCVFGARPEDSYTEEQRARLFAAYREARAAKGGDVDPEHWAAEGGMNVIESPDGKPRRTGPMGTDGDVDRGHFCAKCKAFVVRSDHHCPCLGVCVGAHNQTYFVGMMLIMTLSMWYGSLVSVYAAHRCFTLEAPDTQHCRQLLTVIFAVTFLAFALSCFTIGIFFLCAIDLTIREALALDVLRFKGGPIFVWRRIAANATMSANLERVLGSSLSRLLLPVTRPPSILAPLRLPKEEDLAVHGVYFVVDEHGVETWV